MKERIENRSLTGNFNITLSETRQWQGDKSELCSQIVKTVKDYSNQGYKLTLRQLYYQLVAQDYIPNHDKVYKKLTDPRAKKYVVEHGQVSWEVDALQPNDLIGIN